MKTNKTIAKMVAAASMAVASIVPSFAQNNLGAACGCLPVSSRTTVVNLSSLGTDISTPANNNASVLTATNTVLNCNTIYILDKKIYVDSLKTLTIEPGALIKGKEYSTADSATILVVQRGAKIIADGTESCPIVFTGFPDPMNNTYGVANRGDWGGIAILGKAKNNLTFAVNGNPAGPGKLCVADGVGYVEGFSFANSRNLFGAPTGQTNDNDNSGILRYVSIRHSGAIIATANEIQGLTLGSVGRGTTIDHIDVVSSDDDGIELFGGTVDLKYITAMFGADDMYDWDLGWTGRAQFLFGLAPDSVTCTTADNGFEADAWDNSNTGTTPLSKPIIYNVTIIGNGQHNLLSDNSGKAAIMAKDGTQGEIYNSIFSNYAFGFDTRQVTGTNNVYANWNAGSLKVNCNTFNNIKRLAFGTVPLSRNRLVGGVLAADTTKLMVTDLNKRTISIAGFDDSYAMNTATNAIIGGNILDVIPTANIATTCAATDGFFTKATYQGAFELGKQSWMTDWSYSKILAITKGLVKCPTDVNNDGSTTNADFLQLLGQFNQACQ